MVGGKLAAVGELVAIDLPAGPAWVDVLRRCWDAGDAVLPVDGRLAPPARAALLEAMRPAVLIDASGSRRLPGAAATGPGDALVMATSGTTGAPKGVVLAYDTVEASARATSARLGVEPGTHRWLACLPLAHVGGLSVITRALITGTALTVLPGFSAAEVAAQGGPEVLVSLVATTLGRVGADRFHTVVLGGSAPPSDLAANVVTTYGMTETGSGVVYDGVPLDGVEVAIEGAQQQIRVRGPMLARCYRDGTDTLDGDGWLSTGDAGWFDPDGRLHVRGRLSDLIISGGENVWPAAVEAIVRLHPGVAQVAVAGRRDPEWGQRVVAWVVPRPEAAAPTLDELRGLVRDQLAAFAAPRELELVERLPTTTIGKVVRSQLR